jgi:TatA/E family protein of Tat protein translocase
MSHSLTLLPLAWLPGPLEWVLIALAALLLFGAKLPQAARSLGRALREFRHGMSGEDEAEQPAAPDRDAGSGTDAPPADGEEPPSAPSA